jgi:NADH dehydrogenase/NADH:ubiquinone oxidoreductase subunit G
MSPGPSSISGKSSAMHLVEMREQAKKGKLDVLYVLDGSIDVKGFEKVPNIIYQSPYPSDWIDLAAVILPSATFVEEDGTFVNQEMRPLKLKATVKPPGVARPDWEIISEIGRKLGANGFEFKKVNKIWKELSTFKREIKTRVKWRRASWKPAPKGKHDWYPRYRGATLSERIQDLATFVKALPDRDKPFSKESLDDLVKRLEKEKEAAK